MPNLVFEIKAGTQLQKRAHITAVHVFHPDHASDRLEMIGHGRARASKVETLIGNPKTEVIISRQLNAMPVFKFGLNLILFSEAATVIQVAPKDVAGFQLEDVKRHWSGGRCSDRNGVALCLHPCAGMGEGEEDGAKKGEAKSLHETSSSLAQSCDWHKANSAFAQPLRAPE